MYEGIGAFKRMWTGEGSWAGPSSNQGRYLPVGSFYFFIYLEMSELSTANSFGDLLVSCKLSRSICQDIAQCLLICALMIL